MYRYLTAVLYQGCFPTDVGLTNARNCPYQQEVAGGCESRGFFPLSTCLCFQSVAVCILCNVVFEGPCLPFLGFMEQTYDAV